MMDFGVRFENLVFLEDYEEPCLIVYSKDRQRKEEECWVVNYLNTKQVKELAEYLERYLKRN